jgi:hypothetical protein
MRVIFGKVLISGGIAQVNGIKFCPIILYSSRSIKFDYM